MSAARLAIVALFGLSTVSGAFAQAIEIGPGGIRVDPGLDRRGPPPPPGPRLPPPEPRYSGISEREAIRIARRRGVEEVERVRRGRDGWAVAGVDRYGDRIRVVVSEDGDIIDVRRD